MDKDAGGADRVKRFALWFLLFGLFILTVGAGLFYYSMFGRSSDGIKIIAVSTPAVDVSLSQNGGFGGAIAEKVNLNTSSMDELVALPGIGEVTAAKVIAGRPYKVVSDLADRKIVNKSTYAKIRDLVTAGE